MDLGTATLLAVPALCAAIVLWYRLSTAYLRSDSIQLRQAPALLPLYCAAIMSLFTKPRHMPPRAALRRQQITMGPLVPNLEKLKRYRKLCQCPDSDALNLTALYPTVETFRLSLAAMVAPSFPVSILSGVLCSYRAVMRVPLPPGEALTYRMTLDPVARVTDRGSTEFDISVRAQTADGEEVWYDQSTYSVKGDKDERSRQAPSETSMGQSKADAAASWHELATWKLDAAAGRRYAALNGDINPIHMHSFLAIQFGFRSNVAHGMFLLARCISTVQAAGVRIAFPQVIEAEFKRPCFLPASLQCLVRGEPGAAEGDIVGSVEFAVLPDDAQIDKQVLRGRIGYCVAT